jgi:hypothetical protein
MPQVAFFRPYPFQIGQKITITGGPRRGDWEVIGVSDKHVKLRCPVSFREFDWPLFCYLVEEKEVDTWPHRD